MTVIPGDDPGLTALRAEFRNQPRFTDCRLQPRAHGQSCVFLPLPARPCDLGQVLEVCTPFRLPWGSSPALPVGVARSARASPSGAVVTTGECPGAAPRRPGFAPSRSRGHRAASVSAGLAGQKPPKAPGRVTSCPFLPRWFLLPSPPEQMFLPWLLGTRHWRSHDPAGLLEASSSPFELQRPGSWVTSVLSRAWFPGIPGVAGSSLGLFWDRHKLHPPPVNGDFSSDLAEMGVTSLPNYRGSAGWGGVRAKGVTPSTLPGDPRPVTCGQAWSSPLKRPHGHVGHSVHLEKSPCWAKRLFVSLGWGSWM